MGFAGNHLWTIVCSWFLELDSIGEKVALKKAQSVTAHNQTAVLAGGVLWKQRAPTSRKSGFRWIVGPKNQGAGLVLCT